MTTTLTQTIARLLFTPILMVAAAVLVKGYASVGDGFSAGVIAAVGVLLQYIVFGYDEIERRLPLMRFTPAVTLAGLLLALLVVFGPRFLGHPIVSHFPPPGGEVTSLGMLELHTAFLFDAGVFLVVFGFATSAIRTIAAATHQEDA